MKAGKAVRILLEGIDCPESGQDFGAKAKVFTSGLVFGKDVEVKEYNLDRYGRTVARVYVDSKDLSLELVQAGLAWHFKKYSSDVVLAEAEEQARTANDISAGRHPRHASNDLGPAERTISLAKQGRRAVRTRLERSAISPK